MDQNLLDKNQALKLDINLIGPKVTRQKLRLAPKHDRNSTGLKITRQKIRLALKLDQNLTGLFTRQKSLALKADRNSITRSGLILAYFVGMGRYWYRHWKYWHIDTFFSIASIGIGNPKYRHIAISEKLQYRLIPTILRAVSPNFVYSGVLKPDMGQFWPISGILDPNLDCLFGLFSRIHNF